jgi:hypothetical protein
LTVGSREDVYFGFQFARATKKLPGYAVSYYVDALAADPDALRASFAAYRALDATITPGLGSPGVCAVEIGAAITAARRPRTRPV